MWHRQPASRVGKHRTRNPVILGSNPGLTAFCPRVLLPMAGGKSRGLIVATAAKENTRRRGESDQLLHRQPASQVGKHRTCDPVILGSNPGLNTLCLQFLLPTQQKVLGFFCLGKGRGAREANQSDDLEQMGRTSSTRPYGRLATTSTGTGNSAAQCKARDSWRGEDRRINGGPG